MKMVPGVGGSSAPLLLLLLLPSGSRSRRAGTIFMFTIDCATTSDDAWPMRSRIRLKDLFTSDPKPLILLHERMGHASSLVVTQSIEHGFWSGTDVGKMQDVTVLVNSSIIKAILSSAAEAELGALFYNANDGCMLRNTLQDLGYPQGPTPIQADNACAVGLANNRVKQKRSKEIDMRFYWVKDRVKAGLFITYWRKGAENEADYFTKHHSPSHHRKMRHRYLHVPTDNNKTSCEGVLIQD